MEEYQGLGYEKWGDKTGYGRKFPNESQFGSFNSGFGKEMNVKPTHIGERIGLARMILHDFSQYLRN